MTFQQLYEAINSLPVDERLRLVERVIHDVVEGSQETARDVIEKGSPLDGLFSDVPELVDEVCAAAYQEPVDATPENLRVRVLLDGSPNPSRQSLLVMLP